MQESEKTLAEKTLALSFVESWKDSSFVESCEL